MHAAQHSSSTMAVVNKELMFIEMEEEVIFRAFAMLIHIFTVLTASKWSGEVES